MIREVSVGNVGDCFVALPEIPDIGLVGGGAMKGKDQSRVSEPTDL